MFSEEIAEAVFTRVWLLGVLLSLRRLTLLKQETSTKHIKERLTILFFFFFFFFLFLVLVPPPPPSSSSNFGFISRLSIKGAYKIVCACVRACVHACTRARARVCVCVCVSE